MTKLLSVLALVACFGGGVAVALALRGDEGDAALASDLEARLADARNETRELRDRLDTARATIAQLERGQEQAQARLSEARREMESLRGDLAAARSENAALAQQVALAAEKREAKIAEIMDRLEEFRKSEFETFLKPGALADMVQDLKSLGDTGTKAVIALLDSDKVEDRVLAAQVLMQLDDPQAIDPLKAVALEDESELAAAMASQALMRMDDARAVPALTELVADSAHAGVRVNAMWGLCKHGDDAGIAKAMAYFGDSENPEALRTALGHGILVLREPKLLPLVDDVFHVAAEKKREDALAMAVDYYGDVDTPASRRRLREIAGDESLPESLREAARRALR